VKLFVALCFVAGDFMRPDGPQGWSVRGKVSGRGSPLSVCLRSGNSGLCVCMSLYMCECVYMCVYV
jgi:hypothetical protein